MLSPHEFAAMTIVVGDALIDRLRVGYAARDIMATAKRGCIYSVISWNAQGVGRLYGDFQSALFSSRRISV